MFNIFKIRRVIDLPKITLDKMTYYHSEAAIQIERLLEIRWRQV